MLKKGVHCLVFLTPLLWLTACSKPLSWPDAPLYIFDQGDPGSDQSYDLETAKKNIIGHYAHYDVVAYEDTSTKTTMRSFIVSYGFTDFYLDEGRLMQSDRFVYAKQKLSRKNASSEISDKAVQAIKPGDQEVELSFKEGRWHVYRPATPKLFGIKGDPLKTLSTGPDHPNITDPDQDGKPGITVKINVGRFFKGEIYIIRREIFSYFMTLNSNGTLSGYVEDRSEQLVIGANKKILKQESNSIQHPNRGLSQVLLVPLDQNVDTPEELMALRDKIFPEEPSFYPEKK